MVHVHIGNGLHNFLYSADIKYAKTQLLSPAVTNFPRLETVLLEATYGGKDNFQASPKEEDEKLATIITKTIKQGGKVLMPVLGSGKAQEIIVLLERLIREKRMIDVPIYIDGMVWDITAIHTAYPEFFNSSVRQQIFNKDNNPFLADNIKKIGSHKERTQLVEETGPCVILATSGMLVGGPSMYYLEQLAPNKKNALVFTCYLPPGSLARRIQHGEREFVMSQNHAKQNVTIMKMEVCNVQVSSHADRKELMNFVGNLNPKPRKVMINHGEVARCIDLASSIHKQYRIETIAPRNLDAIRLK